MANGNAGATCRFDCVRYGKLCRRLARSWPGIAHFTLRGRLAAADHAPHDRASLAADYEQCGFNVRVGSNSLRLVGAVLALLVVVASTVSAPAAAKNLLQNSSFEVGVDSRYAIGRWYQNGLPNARLDRAAKVHGEVSLKIPFSTIAYTSDRPDGIELRAATPVQLEKGRTYSFSVSLRTNVPDAGAVLELSPRWPNEYRGKAIAEKKITLGRVTTSEGFRYPWKRHALTFKAPESAAAYWVIRIKSKRPGALWVDALQFEQGPVRPYAASHDVEVGLIDKELGNIHAPAPTVRFDLRTYNNSGTQKSRAVRLRIRNESKTVVFDKRYRVSVPAGGVVTLPIDVGMSQKRGVFLAQLSMDGVPDYRQETSFSVLPRPRPMAAEQSAFGAYLTPSEEAVRILARAGFRWTASLTSKEQLGAWSFVEPKKGRYLWHDGVIDLYRKHGFEVLLNLEGWAYPKWTGPLSREERRRAFAQYVGKIVGHYRGKIRYFTLADEIHNKVPGYKMLGKAVPTWRNPKEYALWHVLAQAEAKRANPDSKIVLNTNPGSYRPDRLFQYMSPKTVDVIAGNYYPYPGAVRELSKAAKKHGVATVWAPGVGVITWPIYFEQLDFRKRNAAKTLRQLRRAVIQSFAGGARVIFHYTATYVGNTNKYSLFEHDSSLRTGGAQFAALAWLLDGFTSAAPFAISPDRHLDAYRFDRQDGKTVFALWSNVDSDRQRLVFAEPVAGLELFDHWSNQLPAGADGRVREVPLAGDAVFLAMESKKADRVAQALRKASLRIESLPSAVKTVREGNYALLEQISQRGRRKEPFTSLWYRGQDGRWSRILRRSGKDKRASWRLTPDGAELRFAYDWNGKAHHIFVGELSTDLVWGGKFWRSMKRKGAVRWETGTISDEATRKRRVVAVAARDHPPTSVRPPAYLIAARRKMKLTIETSGEQPNLKFPMAGAWDFIVYKRDGSGRAGSIQRYIHAGAAKKRDIRLFFRLAPDRKGLGR